jgi:hypothetical protein
MKIATILALGLWLSTCWTPIGARNDQDADHLMVQSLEAEARALANAAGCSSTESCRTAPVGAKACGGPRAHLVYCATTTDVPRLMETLDKLRQAEEAYNRKHGIGSDCAYVTPPRVELDGGVCRAAGHEVFTP